MSALGQKRSFSVGLLNVRIAPKAVISKGHPLRQLSDREGGMTGVPAGRLLIGVGDTARHRFAKPASSELNAVGQAIRREQLRNAVQDQG
jgi:hypothetical protein